MQNIVFFYDGFENNFLNKMVNQVTSVDAIKMMHDTGSILIDVRTPAEWKQTPAPSEVNMSVVFLNILDDTGSGISPLFVKEFMSHGFDRECKIFFVCRSGSRSFHAADICTSLGYECYNIIDGVAGLIAALKK